MFNTCSYVINLNIVLINIFTFDYFKIFIDPVGIILAMSETFVTLPVVRELLTTQERTYKAMIEVFLESIKNEVKEVRQGVTDLKESLLSLKKILMRRKSKLKDLDSS